MNCLPHFCRGQVVKGFGRGSKQLGIPTANFPENVVENLPKDVTTGIYYGWAQVDSGEIHKMVMSIGWNPYYKNEKKSMETHIMHDFGTDFYGSMLSVVLLGFIRGEKNFSSLDELIQEIHNDISVAKCELDKDNMKMYKTNPFFTNSSSKNSSSNGTKQGSSHNSCL